MPIKDLQLRRIYRREGYAKNKLSERKHVYRRRNEIKNWFEDYKKI